MDARLVLQTLVNVRFTVRSFKACLTFARIVPDAIDAVPIPARTALTLVDVDLTVLPHRSGNTNAFITAGIFERKLLRKDGRQILGEVAQVIQRDVRSLQTFAGVLARVGLTLVDVFLAVFASIAGVTFALVVIYFVHTLGSVGARIRVALVDVVLAVGSRVAGLVAVAQVTSELIDAPAAILAGLGLTIVDVDLAEPSRHSGNTHAGKVRHPIDARRSLGAGITLALVDIGAAILATVSRRTDALEIVFLVHALGIVLARMAEALVHVQVAVQSGISRRTKAPKRAGRILTDSVDTDLIFGFALVDVIFAPFALVAGRTVADVVLSLGVTGTVVKARIRRTHVVAVHVVRALTLAGNTAVRFLTVG